jgi:hypothetical protein
MIAKRTFVCLLALFGLYLASPSFAQNSSAGQLITVESRAGVKISYWWMPHPNATQTVLLFSGGGGGMGYRDGQPQSENFLVRSRAMFQSQGFNVAILGNPTDMPDMAQPPFTWRISEQHAQDTAAVIDSIAKSSAAPMWFVGTSAGTISAASVGAKLQNKLAGLVLTASITSHLMPTGVPQLSIESIRTPVLLYHHQDDACRLTLAAGLPLIEKKLAQASVLKTMVVKGGSNPRGEPCQALHWHGFIGMEQKAVEDIATWIKNPQK